MKKFMFALIFITTSLFAFDKASIGYGEGSNGVSIYNVSVEKNINEYNFIDNTNLSFELSIEHLDGKNDDLTIYSAQPILNYAFSDKTFFEVGAGVAHFSEQNLDNRRYGMHFQFKQSIGFGYNFSENTAATLKYNHYSNGDLDKRENSGLDLIMVKVVYTY